MSKPYYLCIEAENITVEMATHWETLLPKLVHSAQELNKHYDNQLYVDIVETTDVLRFDIHIKNYTCSKQKQINWFFLPKNLKDVYIDIYDGMSWKEEMIRMLVLCFIDKIHAEYDIFHGMEPLGERVHCGLSQFEHKMKMLRCNENIKSLNFDYGLRTASFFMLPTSQLEYWRCLNYP